MATVRDILTEAAEDLTVIDPGEELSADDAQTLLRVLTGLYDQAVARAVPLLETEYPTATFDAEPNTRVVYSGTVNTPTLNEDESAIHDGALIYVVAAVPKAWVYDQLSGAWVDVHTLTLNSTAPLGDRGRHYLAAAVAEGARRRFARPFDPTRMADALRGKGILMRIGAAAPVDPEYF